MNAIGSGSLSLGRAAEALLFELQSHDPVALAGRLPLMLVALAAGLVPDRANRIDPMYALKYETSFVGIVGLFPT